MDVLVVSQFRCLSGCLLEGCHHHCLALISFVQIDFFFVAVQPIRMKPKIRNKNSKTKKQNILEDARQEVGGSFQSKSKGPTASDAILSFFLEGTWGLSTQPVFFFFSPHCLLQGVLVFVVGKWWSRLSLVRQKKIIEFEHTRPFSQNLFAFHEFELSQSRDSWIGSKDIFGFASPSPLSARRLLENPGRREERAPLGWLGHLQVRTSSHQADSSARFFFLFFFWSPAFLTWRLPHTCEPCARPLRINGAH